MAALSRAEVAHLAGLARLTLTDDELDLFAGQLTGILDAFGRVTEVASADLVPMSHPVALSNVLREDAPRPCLTRDQALALAPESAEDRFLVPQILDEEA